MQEVLKGIKVLDFGRYIAGPYTATLLGDFGAEVIRVERVRGSEDRYTSPLTDKGEGALWMQVGRNKKSLTLNPLKPEGREIAHKLVATADVISVNLPEESLHQMGLDYETLCSVKPDIILSLATTFGTTGPYAGRLGFDSVGQAMSGAMHLTGDADEPMRSMATYADFGTALANAFGIMMALRERDRSGRGQVVESNLLTTALTFINSMLIEQGITAPDRVAQGNRSQLCGPGDVFKTQDGWVFAMVIGDPLFRRWVELMGEPEWLDDPRFGSDQSRGDNGAILSERTARWCAGRTTQEVIDLLEAARIPAAPVLTPQQALDDPHVREARILRDQDYPGLPKPAKVAEPVVRLSRTPGELRDRPPLLGEHTDQILESLGYQPEQIADLREKRIV
ncbi:MAG: CoA transferase [Rhodospirillales bacterium]|jgi:crotonobetainyl-CoA:carnitine CoA-transferase CaiB-like acyl-CoA transferase|nr:formyl-CoA transferase [Rhodospirillaceae bacterium]MDP6429101.1 CoA transferase [Rhodospirillales bacterium]MDP6645778.1 CoA transferase [Rhodospirillales bacterium]MDP6843488.1 CoA transferase [Rhodospirillales bacterium]